MKTRLFFIVLLMCGLMPTVAQPVVHVNTRDTVRYGDPWYTFKPLPVLNDVMRYDLQLFHPRSVSYAQVYSSSKTLLYGIAVTMDSLPVPADSVWLRCWRGVYTHPNLDPLRLEYVCFDSVPHSDSISTWTPPLLKQCVFEYQVGGDGSDGVYKSSTPVNCFEFYFDEPLPLIPQDTFLIGGYFNPADPIHYQSVPVYAGVDRYGCSQRWMEINQIQGCNNYTYDTMALSADHLLYLQTVYPGYNPHCEGRGSLFWFWGMVFPITELRCTNPRGLEVDSVSRTVRWDHDADGVLFQLSLCADGTLPDNGYIVTTTDTMLSFTALPSLSPDTVYRLYLRKQCDFSTSRAASVWSDWCEPVVLNRNAGGIEGIQTVGMEQVKVYAEEGRIVVEGAEGLEVKVYDVKGSQVANRDLPAGVYMVRIGTMPVRKVVVH